MTPKKTLLAAGALAGALAGGIALTGLPTASAEPPSSCLIQRLPVPEGSSGSTVTGSGPAGAPLLGHVVAEVSPLTRHLALWRDGRVSTAEIPGGFTEAADVNSAGLVVGNRTNAQNQPESWTYDEKGGFRVVGGGSARAVDGVGRLAGDRQAPTGNGPPVPVPVVWPAGADAPVDLPMPGKQTGTATDIGADGTIVGTVGTDAYVWRPDGTHGPLPRPEGVPPEQALSAIRISGPWVVGGDYAPVRWNLETGAAERVPGIETPYGINERGWVVGETPEMGGALVADGEVLPLPTVDGGDGYTHRPAALSPDGRTIGGMAQVRGNPSPVTEEAVVWNCS
ncbi:hypothetical protein [Saccharopolyspora taberi]|uniref:Uncharacterized protein n=1 Tax=Saccharopolyspora taberi TaxID=60895 RepID=A0ABN3VAQ1_9PSEU